MKTFLLFGFLAGAFLGVAAPKDFVSASTLSDNTTAPSPTPTPFFYAARPILYVLYASSLYNGSSSTGSSSGPASGPSVSASAKPVGGSPTSPGAPVSSTDNLSVLLLYEIADALVQGIEKNPNTGPLVVPEPFWSIGQFVTQCEQDKSTLGAIILTGATTTEDGSFNLIVVSGRSQARYFGELLDCVDDDPLRGLALTQKPLPSPMPPSEIWSSAAKGEARPAWAISFFPIAAAGTALAAYETARTVIHPAPGSTSAPYLINQYLYNQAALAIGTFAAATSSVVFGNPTSGTTIDGSFKLLAKEMTRNLDTYCGDQQSVVNYYKSLCGQLQQVTPPPSSTPSPIPK